MTDGLFTPLANTTAGWPVEALTFAPATYRRELAETLALLPAPDQVDMFELWRMRTGALWNPPAEPGNGWGPLEAAITSWIKLVRRSDQDMEDAA